MAIENKIKVTFNTFQAEHFTKKFNIKCHLCHLFNILLSSAMTFRYLNCDILLSDPKFFLPNTCVMITRDNVIIVTISLDVLLFAPPNLMDK